MGTFRRTNLFYGVDHEQVYAALDEFWRSEEHTLKPEDVTDVNLDAYALHERRGDWTVLQWTRGWEWDLRRRAQPVRPGDGYGRLEGDVYWGFQDFLGVERAPVWRRFTTLPRSSPKTDN